MSSPPGMDIAGGLDCSLVTPSSNQCSSLPFLPFSVGWCGTNGKDPGNPGKQAPLSSSPSAAKSLSHQTQYVSISVCEIDQKKKNSLVG